ncbi:hypothetical protein EGW08_005996 [Elysia chlorotica]|uniref:Gustatory receptor n=1 Tax=Elysia chlorotica TaxID=188477 RepID=A0A433TXC8_ELYCH|nr:hypothetical protein EGW08_005996 [Elysia chlorotica]
MFVRTVSPTMERISPCETAAPGAATAATTTTTTTTTALDGAQAPHGEKSLAEERHPSASRPCDFSACQLYSVIRYPVIVMSMCGVYVPSYCICHHAQTRGRAGSMSDRDVNGETSSSLNANHGEEGGLEINGCSSKASSMFFAEASRLTDSRKKEETEVVATGRRTSPRVMNSTINIESCGKQRSCKNSDRRWWGLVKRAGCVSMFACHSINSFRYAFILREASRETSQLVFSLAMFFILSTYFYLMAFNSFACRSHFTSFIASAREFEVNFSGFKTNFKQLFRIHGVVFVIGFINQSLNATIFMYGVLHSFGGVSPQMWPFKDLEGGWLVLLALVVGFSVFSAGANQYGTNIFRAVLTGVVEDEFKGLKKDLETILSHASRSAKQDSIGAPHHIDTPSNDTTPTSALLTEQEAALRSHASSLYPTLASCSSGSGSQRHHKAAEVEFDRFLHRFRAVSGLLDQGYHLTKHTMAAAYIFGVPTLCVLVYGLVSSSVTRDQWVVLSLNVIVAGAVLAHTTWTLARLGTTAESVCDTVYDADWSKFSHTFLQKMVLFTTMFSKKRFGINVYGLFRIEWPTLLVLGSSLLIYSIVIILFHLGNPTAICHFGNFTV